MNKSILKIKIPSTILKSFDKIRLNKSSSILFGLGLYFLMKNKAKSILSKESDKIKEKNLIHMFNSVFVLPHVEKRFKGGEDAYYISSNLIAVADGVGGWNSYGIDPSLYSKELCSHIKEEAEKNKDYSEEGVKEILVKAAYRTKATGSSTCCLILLDINSYKIFSANIGDSGYLIIRNEEGKLVEYYKSEEQQHSFNFPFQIGTNGDNPNEAVTKSHELKDNDIIILGSDGLWDNLESSHIIEVLNKHLSSQGRISNSQQAAQDIAEYAEMKSLDKSYESPFAVKAKQNRMRYRGGKPDDITVIVAQLEESNKILSNKDQ